MNQANDVQIKAVAGLSSPCLLCAEYKMQIRGPYVCTDCRSDFKRIKEGYTVTPKDTVTGPQKQEIGFEVGKWYFDLENNIIGRLDDMDDMYADLDNVSPYLGMKNNEYTVAFLQFKKHFKPATVEQIREHLIALAKEKGYLGKSKYEPFERSLNGRFGHNHWYSEFKDELWIIEDEEECACIYKAGQWASIIPHKPSSVWELCEYEDYNINNCKDLVKSGELAKKSAFSILLQAVEKWNEKLVFDEEYYWPYVNNGKVDWNSNEDNICSPFRFNTQQSLYDFFALEDAVSLFKVYLGVNENK